MEGALKHKKKKDHSPILHPVPGPYSQPLTEGELISSITVHRKTQILIKFCPSNHGNLLFVVVVARPPDPCLRAMSFTQTMYRGPLCHRIMIHYDHEILLQPRKPPTTSKLQQKTAGNSFRVHALKIRSVACAHQEGSNRESDTLVWRTASWCEQASLDVQLGGACFCSFDLTFLWKTIKYEVLHRIPCALVKM